MCAHIFSKTMTIFHTKYRWSVRRKSARIRDRSFNSNSMEEAQIRNKQRIAVRDPAARSYTWNAMNVCNALGTERFRITERRSSKAETIPRWEMVKAETLVLLLPNITRMSNASREITVCTTSLLCTSYFYVAFETLLMTSVLYSRIMGIKRVIFWEGGWSSASVKLPQYLQIVKFNIDAKPKHRQCAKYVFIITLTTITYEWWQTRTFG